MAKPCEEMMTDAIAALILLDVNAATIARHAGVAVATVTRWSQGYSKPPPLTRPAIMTALKATARAEIRQARASLAA